jgi:hypothetical protein
LQTLVAIEEEQRDLKSLVPLWIILLGLLIRLNLWHWFDGLINACIEFMECNNTNGKQIDAKRT